MNYTHCYLLFARLKTKLIMTPKAKAKELAEKFTNSTDVVRPNIGSIEKALLCVGFIIEAEPSKKRKTLTMVGERKITVSNKTYWKKVKKELQELSKL